MQEVIFRNSFSGCVFILYFFEYLHKKVWTRACDEDEVSQTLAIKIYQTSAPVTDSEINDPDASDRWQQHQLKSWTPSCKTHIKLNIKENGKCPRQRSYIHRLAISNPDINAMLHRVKIWARVPYLTVKSHFYVQISALNFITQSKASEETVTSCACKCMLELVPVVTWRASIGVLHSHCSVVAHPCMSVCWGLTR